LIQDLLLLAKKLLLEENLELLLEGGE